MQTKKSTFNNEGKIRRNSTYHKRNKKNKTIIAITILLVVIFSIVFLIIVKQNNKNKTKNIKIGNNSSSQEIVDNILNINTYKTEVEVEIKSNKNSNKYKLKQIYSENEENSQEVIEPSNIAGVKIIKEGNNLKLENSNLNISKIIENYKEITQNSLDLNSFIENYKINSNSRFKENGDTIVMKTTAKSNNNYNKYETLYISKESKKPIKLEIKDSNQNTIIYITYNKIEI